ncbi:MAG: aminoacyl-tRNA deacylase [Candidatus Hodarchaeales archaeon]|jgi:prolyl-tRNA editing enzyme YbaK/EbsC (Cys-tRNA(Pro) deacylase)
MGLQQYIDENGLRAEIITLGASTTTVDESVKALGCESEEIIKSIIVVASTNEYYLVILQGNRKIRTKKLKKLLNVKDVKLASPEQVKKVTGYKVGDVPPISVELPVILDELVIEGKKLYGGGGAPTKLMTITVDELLDCTHPLIADVSTPI